MGEEAPEEDGEDSEGADETEAEDYQADGQGGWSIRVAAGGGELRPEDAAGELPACVERDQ